MMLLEGGKLERSKEGRMPNSFLEKSIDKKNEKLIWQSCNNREQSNTKI